VSVLRLADPAAALAFARDELVRLIEIPSFSDEEHAIVNYVERRCGELDVPSRRQPVDGSADNLVIGWSERPELLLTAHLDTIRPTWDFEPRAEVRGDRLHGLGALDDKSGVVACLLGLLLARDAGVPVESLPVAVGLCVDEEVDGKGSIAMAEELRPRFVVGVEGTGLELGLAEAGFVDVWYTVRGTSVHGAFREDGDNAIEKAVRFVNAVHAAPLANVVHPILGRSIPFVWEFHGGQDLNVVPDVARLRIDVRVVPGMAAADVQAALEELSLAYDAEMELVEPAVEPFETPRDAPLARAMAAAVGRATGRVPGVTGVQCWTDTHNFVDLCGAQAVVFGPGHLLEAHRPDESVDLRDVVACGRAFAEVLAGAERLLGEVRRCPGGSRISSTV
jgi:acetylornithine deacetylase/succinyl-diaminopimelate desuccinylase-like protein